jgi:uncharacterized RDD family membrane protein YckC
VTIADSVSDFIKDAVEAFNPPPQVALSSYPSAVAVAVAVAFTAILLVVSHKFDPTQGALTISILIVLGMLGAVAYCLIFTIPADDITPGIVGGLTAGFGAVVAHWLGRTKEPPPPPPGD